MHLLRQELARWEDLGKKARFWVRDDDAIEVTPALHRLTQLCLKYGAPIGLAVIPGLMQSKLVEFVDASSGSVVPMCHGWRHINHEQGPTPSEFGPSREVDQIRSDLSRAIEAFAISFPASLPVFVPPFNRIASNVELLLAEIGFPALSSSASPIERRTARIAETIRWIPPIPLGSPKNLPRLDAQIDLIDWRARSARNAAEIERNLVGFLRLRRLGLVPDAQPVGLLTHHLVHEASIWRLLEDLLAILRAEPSAVWCNVTQELGRQIPRLVASAGTADRTRINQI